MPTVIARSASDEANSSFRVDASHRTGVTVLAAIYLFLLTGLRFSMKAAMPSDRSSSAKVE